MLLATVLKSENTGRARRGRGCMEATQLGLLQLEGGDRRGELELGKQRVGEELGPREEAAALVALAAWRGGEKRLGLPFYRRACTVAGRGQTERERGGDGQMTLVLRGAGYKFGRYMEWIRVGKG